MFCPACGSKNPEEDASCRLCGSDLTASAEQLKKPRPQPVAAAPSAPRASTVLGVAIPASGSQAAPPSPGPISARPAPAPVSVGGAPPQAKQPGQGRGTMLGVAMPAPGSHAAPPGPGPISSHPSPAPVSVGAPPVAKPASHGRGTMLGVAMPAPGSVAPPVAPEPPPPPITPAPPSPGMYRGMTPQPSARTAQPLPPGGGRQVAGTMMGVAAPAPGSVAPPQSGFQSGSPLRSDDRPQLTPRAMLAELIRARGAGLSEDAEQVEALIYREFQHNVSLLTAAQRAGVPAQLQQAASGEGVLAATMRLVALLVAQGLSADDARYAVDSWAIGLGL